MKIKILDMDLKKGLFLVGSLETGEQLQVTGYQLTYSLTCTNTCVNAKLHKTGMIILGDNNETIIYNVKPIDAKLKAAIRKYMNEHPEPVKTPVQRKEIKQTSTESGVLRDRQVKNNCIDGKCNIRQRIVNAPQRYRDENIKVYYMGTLYTAKDICKKYGCDNIEGFVKLYKLGYPMLMCLGKEPLDKNLKVTPRDKQFDSYLKTTGQYN